MMNVVEEQRDGILRFGWPYPQWLLVALKVLLALSGVVLLVLGGLMSADAVRYEGSSVVGEFLGWGSTVAVFVLLVRALRRQQR